MSTAGIANKIQNVLTQCDTTVINIGQIDGHFLSSKQFAVLEECVRELSVIKSQTASASSSTSAATLPNDEFAIRGRRAQLKKLINQKHIDIAAASTSDRSDLNLDLGRLLSERAKLDKLIKQLDSTSS